MRSKRRWLRLCAANGCAKDLVVAIAGPPNAGKSTLLNRLARREAAIVSPHAGTTRDVIEVHLDLGGYPVVLLDTAGIRDTSDPIEEEGVRRARERAAEADLVLWLTEPVADQVSPPESTAGSTWLVVNKIDRVEPIVVAGGDVRTFRISARDGQGVGELTSALGQHAAEYFGAGESALVDSRPATRACWRLRLRRSSGRGRFAAGSDEIVAEELRSAAHALGRLLGRVDVEDILSKIFKDFCIGK